MDRLPAKPPKLLDRLANALHERQYAPALVRAYSDWARRFIYFHRLRHPAEMGDAEVAEFLDYLAGDGGATCFQRDEAGRALRFLYLVLLDKPLGGGGEEGGETALAGRAPKLLDQLRQVLRVRHYARSTEDTYSDWVKRYILFHRKRHPAAMGAAEVSAFLTRWAAGCPTHRSGLIVTHICLPA